MFFGSLVAMVTPMSEKNEVDYSAIENLVAYHIKHGTEGLVILGTTGESATIKPNERQQIISQVVSLVQKKIPVIVGTGTNATSHTIELTQEALQLGADAALLVTPYYNKPTQEGLYQHYRAVAEAVSIPQILYNVPLRTACDLLPETVKRLDRFSNIVALKEARADLNRLTMLLDFDCQMDMLSGDDPTAMDFILSGGKGVISVTANIAPNCMQNMVKAARVGDRNKARMWNNKLKTFYKCLFLESNPIPVKWALFKMGLIGSGIRLPLTPLSSSYHSLLQSAIDQINVKEGNSNVVF